MLLKIFTWVNIWTLSVQSWIPEQIVKNLKKNRTFATFYQSKKNCEGEEQSEKNFEGEEQTKKKCEGEEQRPNNEKIANFRGGRFGTKWPILVHKKVKTDIHMLKNLESVRNITCYLFTKKARGGEG